MYLEALGKDNEHKTPIRDDNCGGKVKFRHHVTLMYVGPKCKLRVVQTYSASTLASVIN
jgi:hypothetical protein